MAQQNISAILVDGDMRRGVQSELFAVDKKPGLSDYLGEITPVTPAYISKFVRKTHIRGLSLLPSGSSIPNSTEMINSIRFRELLEYLSTLYEIIILDTPPLAVTTDAVGVHDFFTSYLIVVRAGHTDISHLNRKTKEFPGFRKKILGIVFNGAPYKRPEYYQYSSYKY
jgi:tyrosine-protein kinase Etk/Wzc